MKRQKPTEFAAAIGKSLNHVYAHSEAYGAVRFGPGPRARMEFPETEEAIAHMQRWRAEHDPERARSTRGRPGPKPGANRPHARTLKLPVYN